MQGPELASLCLAGFMTWGMTDVYPPSSQEAMSCGPDRVTVFCPVHLVTSPPPPPPASMRLSLLTVTRGWGTKLCVRCLLPSEAQSTFISMTRPHPPQLLSCLSFMFYC